MNTFLKNLLARVFGDGVLVLLVIVIVALIGAVVADRAISQGKNVELNVASFLTFTATNPTPPVAESQSPLVGSAVESSHAR